MLWRADIDCFCINFKYLLSDYIAFESFMILLLCPFSLWVHASHPLTKKLSLRSMVATYQVQTDCLYLICCDHTPQAHFFKANLSCYLRLHRCWREKIINYLPKLARPVQKNETRRDDFLFRVFYLSGLLRMKKCVYMYQWPLHFIAYCWKYDR